ncbi:MAG: acetate/propionate family kinase [Phycisphaerae bacterium]
MGNCILTINGGSSSIKFALFDAAASDKRLLTGSIERIGAPNAKLAAKSADGSPLNATLSPDNARDHRAAARELIAWLTRQIGQQKIVGIGHRVVHGGLHLTKHQPITPELVAELRRTQPLDLAHLPREIALIETFQEQFPPGSGVIQIACFDTAFHHNLPRVAQLFPIPRKHLDAGIRRFGFHGLSYTYLLRELQKIAPQEAAGKVIFAHLGSGASMAAVHNGQPIDTTMAFTPTAGIVMGTRPGDIDPGLLVYLLRVEKISAEQMDDYISNKCGLLGVSGTSADIRDLQAAAPDDPRAQDALNLFCYTATKAIASLASTMNGLDALIFSAGIGEHDPAIRARICQNLQFLGLTLDEPKNTSNAAVISSSQSRIKIRIIPTDEELIIAQTVASFVKQEPKQQQLQQ